MSRNAPALIFLGVFVAAVSLREPRYLSAQSLESILLWLPLLLVAAAGQLGVVLGGGIDLSVGSIVGFAGIASGIAMREAPGLPIPAVFLIGSLAGLGLGLVNGSIVAIAGVPPLIATIGTLAAFRGLTFIISGGDQIDSSMIPESLTALAREGIEVGGVTLSWLLVLALSIGIVSAVVLQRTPSGRRLLAFGGSPEGARVRGVSDRRILCAVYAASGAAAGLAGVIYAARFGFVNPGTAGMNMELSVIAAVAIGGVRLTGGEGTMTGVFLGCLLLACINVALTVLGIDADWQLLAYGIVIVAAVLLEGALRRGRGA